MNKSSIIAVIVGLLILVMAGVLYFLDFRTPQPLDNLQTSIKPTPTLSSLRELITTIDNQSCSFEDTEGNSGNVYVSDGNMRGDFQTRENGEGHTLVLDETVYVWFENDNEGFKTSVNSFESLSSQNTQVIPGTVDVGSDVDFSCKPWNVTSTVFQVPTEFTFTEYNSALSPDTAKSTEAIEPTPHDGCTVCESLPIIIKDHCLRSLSCN